MKELKHLILILEEAGISSLEFASAGRGMRLKLQASENSSEGTAVAIEGTHATVDGERIVVAADLPGIFLVKHPVRSAPFVAPVDTACAGDILGLIRIRHLYVPVIAPESGVVTRVLAEAEAQVEFGTPLFEILVLPSIT